MVLPDHRPCPSSCLLKAAVIGVGYLGRFHAQKYAAMQDVELVAVADLLPEQAMRIGQELGVKAVQNYVDLLDHVDLVSVVTPTPTHFRVVETCLSAGVHVLVEKPITTTLAEADALLTLAEQKQCTLQVGHIKRFHPAVQALTASRLLSHPGFIDAQRLAPFKNRALDVDVVLDLMIHDVDLILHFMGSSVVDVEAFGVKVMTNHVDIAHARLRFENGAIANLSASRVARTATRRMRIFQADGFFDLDFIQQTLQMSQRGVGEPIWDGVPVQAIEETSLPLTRHDALETEIRSFCQAVREHRPPVVSGHDGRRALAVLTAIQQKIAQFEQHFSPGSPPKNP